MFVANNKTCAILYSDKVPMVMEKEQLTQTLPNLNTKLICADNPLAGALDDVDILVNPLGPYYPEAEWKHILEFYQRGGAILNIGLKPFSIPFVTEGSEVRFLAENAVAIRSLHVVEDWILSEPTTKNMQPEIYNQRYRFIAEIINAGEFPEMNQTCSASYRLTESPLADDRPFESDTIRDSRLEVICGVRDASGRLVAAPITRIDHFKRGSLVFLNFEPEGEFYNSESGRKLLAGIIKTMLPQRFTVELTNEFARYKPSESPKITSTINLLGPNKNCHHKLNLKLSLFSNEQLIDEYTIEPSLKEGAFSAEWELKPLLRGYYSVVADLLVDGEIYAQHSNGFFQLGDEDIQDMLKKIKPIYLDTTITTDYCIRDGKPFAMHGSNYFPSDIHRDCFVDFNPEQCEKDLLELKSVGVNILRTGIWQTYREVYQEDGNIREKSLRAMEAFFLVAAGHDLYVQFVLGTFVMNHWDRDKCPIHNPEMRSKTINAFASFAKRFKGWTNVQVDAINEPSYSYKGLWQTARPSGDKYELENWRNWLKEKYNGNLSMLREAWGVGVETAPDFSLIEMPNEDQFFRDYGRKATYVPVAPLTDFFQFARESYSNWVEEIKTTIKDQDPKMLFMMGRDEPLRIPEQQYEAYKENIEIVNWHHWHRDSEIFTEYLFNRVRGIPCCGQELGVYHSNEGRGLLVYDDHDYANVLERKLLYSFGNWIQWQAHCDPYMFATSEINLGLFRADGTETKHLDVVRLLSWIEEKTAHLMINRDEDDPRCVQVLPNSLYYSADNNLAIQGATRATRVLHYHLKQRANVVLEHLLHKDNVQQIGNPKLIIFPAAVLVSDDAWQYILDFVREGKTALISGHVSRDEYWRQVNRLQKLGVEAQLENITGVEKIQINGEMYYPCFQETVEGKLAGKAINKLGFEHPAEGILKIKLGKGKLIISALPLELSKSDDAIGALYKMALAEANVVDEVLHVKNKEAHPNLLIYPISYDDCTLYTIVNEGTDDTVEFTDLASGKNITLSVPAQRGAKLWLGKDGKLLGAYLNGRLKIGDLEIITNGDLALCYEQDKVKIMAGERKERQIKIDEQVMELADNHLFKEMVL